MFNMQNRQKKNYSTFTAICRAKKYVYFTHYQQNKSNKMNYLVPHGRRLCQIIFPTFSSDISSKLCLAIF